jgi:hypothetical protein
VTIDSAAILSWGTGHIGTALGAAAAVVPFEPKSNQQIDYSLGATFAAVWLGGLAVAPERSGTANTAARVELFVRLHRNALGDAAAMAATEIALLTAQDAILASLIGDLRLDGSMWLDIKGQTGDAIKAATGYLTLDNKLHRVTTMTVGIVVDDAWPESE